MSKKTSNGAFPSSTDYTIYQVVLDAQGYDELGRYWGVDKPLWLCDHPALDTESPLGYSHSPRFCRADNQVDAFDTFFRRIHKLHASNQ